MKAKETGHAEIKVILKYGLITIQHGSTGEVLRQFEAVKGSWDIIWEGINKAEQNANV